MSNPDETLREQLAEVIALFRLAEKHSMNPDSPVDAIMQLFRTTIEDCLPPYVHDPIENTDGSQGAYNLAITATREAFARVVG